MAYQLVTDSSSDLPAGYLEEEKILSLPLSFSIDGKQYYSGQMDMKEFYARMRAGALPITSAVNIGDSLDALERVLKKGLDILYIGFSSNMSSTFQNVKAAADELRSKYPERRIEVVDSKSASLGEGMLVWIANDMKKAGESIDKVAEWVRDHVLNVAHFITCSDMKHLHRGGRVSRTTAAIGTILGIQPMVYLNDIGEATMMGVKRGKRNALNGLVDYMKKVMGDTVNKVCYITHTDCEDEALYVKERVTQMLGVKEFMIELAGPVLGAHTGPGSVALSMMTSKRL